LFYNKKSFSLKNILVKVFMTKSTKKYKSIFYRAFWSCFFLVSINNNSLGQGIITINNETLYSPKTLQNKALKAFEKKDFGEAGFLFEKILSKKEDFFIRKNYGYCLFMLGNYKKASKQFTIILAQSDNSELKSYSKAMLAKIKSPTIVKTLTQIINLMNDKSTYLCNNQEPTISEDGTFKRWDKSEFPLKVYIPPPSDSLEIPDKQKYIDLVKKSIKKWQEQNPELIAFNFVDIRANAQIIINWFDFYKNVSNWSFSTLPEFYDDLQKKVSYINIAVRTQPGSAKFTDKPVFFTEKELAGLVIHETGHALGLGHSDGNDDIMNSKFHKLEISQNSDWDFSTYDLNSLKKLYSFPPNSRIKCNEKSNFSPKKKKQFQYNYTDLRKETSDFYLCFLTGNPTLYSDGKSYLREYSRWEEKDFPLKVYIPVPLGKEYETDNPEHYKELVRQAMEVWSDKVSDIIKFNFVDNEKEAKIIIKWSNYFKEEPYWGAAQSYTDPENPGRKTKCVINLAIKAQPGWYSSVPIIFSDQTFINIVTHETGHALGLDHGPDRNGATGSGALITERDINTLKRLYSVPIGNQFICSL
jgi:predicted Zn-dependent protease